VILPDGGVFAPPIPRRIDGTMHGQGARPRLPLAKSSGEWPLRYRRGPRAAAEKINTSYVSRVLCLTLLAPNIVEMILDGRQPAALTLAVLMRPFAVGWPEQNRLFWLAE